ncbi:hypothetical protein [Pulveribacter suum]|uniref:hypothetical protein n=1 Tax=Pulveribacter suum TaxID=2116657 RepID=UPI001D0384F8|nr:hypothetical protein [Pulveribacter suum]
MTDTPAPPVTEDAPALYDVLARELPEAEAFATLHIGGSHTTLASGQAGSQPLLQRTLDLGARVTAATRFADEQPQPDELLAAAQEALAAFQALQGRVPEGASLYTADGGIRQIALAGGLEAQPQMQLPLALLEQVFEELLAAPAADGAQPGPRLAATVVILRACMQALGFQGVTIRSDAVA